MKQKIIIILIGVIFLTASISLLELEKQNKKVQSFEKAYELLNKLHSDLINSDELLKKDIKKLQQKYNKLEQNYEYALEMKEICLDDPVFCQEIKNKINESKKNDLI